MTPTLLKFNHVILIVLSIGMTLIHNSSQTGEITSKNVVKWVSLCCIVDYEWVTVMDGVKFEFNDTISLYKNNDSERRWSGGTTIEKKKMDLYYMPGSPPCRSVLLTAKALDLEFNLIHLDLFQNEHMKKEFTDLNPQHCVPTLVDGDLVLWESRAIIAYLVETYGGDDHPLFPKDTKMRARINQRLQYDLGTLYPTFVNQYYLWLFNYAPKSDEKEKEIHEALAFLEIFLKSSKWVAGSSMTLADISLVATISTFEVSGVDLNRYEHISKWLQLSKSEVAGYYEINQYGVDRFKALIDEKSDSVTQTVTKQEIFAAIQVLRKAIEDKVIGEQHSDLLKTLESAVPIY